MSDALSSLTDSCQRIKPFLTRAYLPFVFTYMCAGVYIHSPVIESFASDQLLLKVVFVSERKARDVSHAQSSQS